ncbi:MAG: hypothetical protein PHH08_02170 [Candidatus ainarchaeum sp.]|nr:hypothetical protein [Candidatus ainarchaeum sp.]
METLLQAEQREKIYSFAEESFLSKEAASPFWLTGIKYLEEKKAILAEFSCGESKRTFSLAFFPCLLVSKKTASKESLKQEMSLLGNQKFELIEFENSYKVVSSNFSILQRLANGIFASTGAISIMPLPETQFLIQKNWGFFDAFDFEETSSGTVPKKIDCFGLPNVRTDFFSEPLPKTIAELYKIDAKEADSILSLVSMSKLLFLPLEKIPATGFLRQELFLENFFFRNNFVPGSLAKQSAKESHTSQAAGFFRGRPEFDLAPLIPMLLTNACYNIGFETLDCECCEPGNYNAGNLLPSSFVEVEFLKDVFYFDSVNSCFSDSFHESSPFKENRLRRKKEFFLKTFPVGPFSRNEKCLVPLPDAIVLEQNRDAKILSFSEKHWSCRNRESLLSGLVLETREKAFQMGLALEKASEKFFSGNNIVKGLFSLEKDFSSRLVLEHKKNLEFFLNNLPLQAANPESRFFDKKLASAIEAIQANSLNAFEKLNSEGGREQCLLQSPLAEYLRSFSNKPQ